MARPPQDVTDAELAVLEVLWDQGPSSRRRIADVLYPGGQPAHYTTVQKLLERLESKGHVACRTDTPVRTFAATVTNCPTKSKWAAWSKFPRCFINSTNCSSEPTFSRSDQMIWCNFFMRSTVAIPASPAASMRCRHRSCVH